MSELERVGNHHRKVVAGLEREIAQLVRDRNEWMVKAGKATALASQYLRERDRYRSELEEVAKMPCRYTDADCVAHWPDKPQDWCYSCRARDALNREE